MAVQRAALDQTQGFSGLQLGAGPRAILQQLWRQRAQNTRMPNTNGAVHGPALSRRRVARTEYVVLSATTLPVYYLPHEGSSGPATPEAGANPQRVS